MIDFVKVASLDQLPPGRMIGVKVEDEEVALYNVDGRVYATRDVCTHQHFPLTQGELRGKVVTCAFHQWRYDVVTGANVERPEIHVRCYETRVQGRDVFVRLVALPPPEPPPFVSRDDA
ncbi:MAG TPA: Rieske 2Fe-2S domain-containing protein [Planctomycetota bacterium]|nr:Rieske 2Fe-2S domain-containing protein [Planctomycetota bacterium]